MRALLRRPGPLVGVIVFALVSVLLTATVAGTLSRSVGADAREVRAEFSDAAGLRVGDDVRIAGVRVGRVSDTELHGDLALVTLQVDRGQQLDTSTVASINYLNLMGQRYVALEGGHADRADPLADDAVIPVSQTRPALDLTALFNAFRPLFDNLRPEDVNRLAENIVAVLQGEGPTLRDLVRQTASLTSHVAERDQVIGDVIDNVTLVLRTADGHREQIRTLIGELGNLTHGLARDRRAIGASITSMRDLTSLTSGLLDDTGPAVTRDIRALRELGRFLAANTSSLAAAAAGIPKQLGVYIRSLGYGSYLNVYICNLLVKLPGAPGVPVDVVGNRHSERCR